MKKIAFLLFLLISEFGYAGQDRYSFNVGSDTFELKYEVKDVTTSNGAQDLVLYSVYKNGRFVHSEKENGGRFFSCKYKKPKVLSVSSDKSQIGWMFTGGGICGNTSSYKVELIIPIGSYSTTYYTKTLISKEFPLIKPSNNGFSIWYYEQNWGHGGTAASFYVPNKVIVDLKDEFFIFKKGNILNDIDVLTNSDSPKWLQSFLGFFVAGIRDVNPELMQYALDNHYSAEQKEWISVHFGQSNKKYFQQLIQKIQVTKELLKETEGIIKVDPGS